MHKSLKLLSLLLLATLFVSSMNVNVVAQHHESVSEDCNATLFLTITADASQILFDKDELKAPQSTCVQLKLVNLNPIMEHDFTIDKYDGTTLTSIHIHLADNKDGPNGDGIKTLNFTTPAEDKTYYFYCSVTGHEATMNGNFIVGEGSSEDSGLPGFEFFLAFTAMLALATILARFRRK
ncbi:MAG: hypothetical protein ACW98K_11680 [Candidatus Kariarchaeaceae archaeon]|jgi:hypothetical protein